MSLTTAVFMLETSSRQDAFNVWEVKVDWCKNETHKNRREQLKKTSFSNKKNKDRTLTLTNYFWTSWAYGVLFLWLEAPRLRRLRRLSSATERSTKKESSDYSLVPRRSRFGHSWTLPWAVPSPRDTRPLSPRLRADNGSRQNAYGLGWWDWINAFVVLTVFKTLKNDFNVPPST